MTSGGHCRLPDFKAKGATPDARACSTRMVQHALSHPARDSVGRGSASFAAIYGLCEELEAPPTPLSVNCCGA